MSRTLSRLVEKIEGANSTEGIALIQKIAASGDPGRIAALAAQLDIPGMIGRAAVRALIAIGDDVECEMRACLDADDSDMIANARSVLTALDRRRTRPARLAALARRTSAA